jgi:hypothetical protein
MLHLRLPWCLILCGAILTLLAAGCDDDQRVVDVALESAERQAQQSHDVTRLNEQVAQGTRRLAESQAAAREELVALQRDVQQQRDALDAERRELGALRWRESLLAPAVGNLGLLLVAALALALCWRLLGALKEDPQDTALGEILTLEIAAQRSTLLPVDSTEEDASHDSGTLPVPLGCPALDEDA